MSDLYLNWLKYINEVSKSDWEFLDNIFRFLSIRKICEMLHINRNRYNYLVRTNQLNKMLLKYRKEK